VLDIAMQIIKDQRQDDWYNQDTFEFQFIHTTDRNILTGSHACEAELHGRANNSTELELKRITAITYSVHVSAETKKDFIVYVTW
jgi:hypothetical protein